MNEHDKKVSEYIKKFKLDQEKVYSICRYIENRAQQIENTTRLEKNINKNIGANKVRQSDLIRLAILQGQELELARLQYVIKNW